MKTSKKRSTYLLVTAIAGLCIAPIILAQNGEIPRTVNGRPDFSGTYDVSTLTPFQRPSQFGNRLILTNDEAFGIANAEFERKEENQVGRSQPLGTPSRWRWFYRCGRERRRLQHILGRQRHGCGADRRRIPLVHYYRPP